MAITEGLPVTEGLTIGIELSMARQSESSSWEPASNCQGCFAACCRADMALPLTRKEAETLREKGAQMTEIDGQGIYRPGLGRKFYQLDEDCPNLDQDSLQCTAYKDRPKACREFKAGTATCAAYQLGQSRRRPELVPITDEPNAAAK